MNDQQQDKPNVVLEQKKAADKAFTLPLRILRWMLPGDRIRTFVYLNLLAKPRKFLHRALNGFYRFDQVYEILRGFRREFHGPFSILEFGTAQGYAFAKLLYATRYLKMEDDVIVHGFDSFEGLSTTDDEADQGLFSNDWIEGSYAASYETLRDYCEQRKYRNYRIHKGFFEDSITPEVIEQLQVEQPILVWIDCDYYTSSATVFERLLPILPTGCVVYFDDLEFNFGSRFTGEARLVHEVNSGKFGDDLELILDRDLSWNSMYVYRFIRHSDKSVQYRPIYTDPGTPVARSIQDGSPLP
jgi:hypothetical protein